MNNLGNRIKELRLEREMTQEELAVQLNVTKATISLYESNKRVPPLEKIIGLTEIFGVTVDDLIQEKIIFTYNVEICRMKIISLFLIVCYYIQPRKGSFYVEKIK